MPQRNKPLLWLPLSVIGMGILLISSSIAWLVGEKERSAADTPTPFSQHIPYPEIQRISVKEAKAALDAKAAVFVDVRSQWGYLAGHIPGALSITEEELPERLGELNPADWIITYCS